MQGVPKVRSTVVLNITLPFTNRTGSLPSYNTNILCRAKVVETPCVMHVYTSLYLPFHACLPFVDMYSQWWAAAAATRASIQPAGITSVRFRATHLCEILYGSVQIFPYCFFFVFLLTCCTSASFVHRTRSIEYPAIVSHRRPTKERRGYFISEADAMSLRPVFVWFCWGALDASS